MRPADSNVLTSALLIGTLLAHAAAAAGQTAQVPLPRIAFEDSLSQAPPPLSRRGQELPIPVAARIRVVPGVEDRALAERLAWYESNGIPVWLVVAGPASLDTVEPWRASLQALLARRGGEVAILEVDVTGLPSKLGGFAVRLASIDARSERESIRVAVGGIVPGDAPALAEIYTSELAPYVDLLAVPDGTDVLRPSRHLLDVDPGARLVVTGAEAGEDRESAARRVLDSQLDSLGTDVVMRAWRLSGALEQALRALLPLAPLMAGEVSALDAEAASLRLTLDGRDVTASIRHRLLFEGRTFATYLVYWGEGLSGTLQASLVLPVEGVPAVHRLLDGGKLAASDYARAPETGQVRTALPLADGPMLVDFNEGAAELFVERSDVMAERRLSVEEIIARHQQQQRLQDALVQNYAATARMEQHFRPTMTDPGYDVVTENRYYVAGGDIEWEELSFSVNGSKWGADRPPFPLLQPEKVLSLPLQLRFDDAYRYRLAGTDRVGAYDCYMVRFEPVAAGQSLYRGTVWIEQRTFARLKVQAVQTGLSAPVVSNEEIQTYTPVTSIGNHPVFLFTGLSARQIMLIAGRNLLVEKTVAFRDFRVNEPDFQQSRDEARRSDRIMYKETERGLRYYVKEGERRVVSERATRTARAMAMGVTLDPSYPFPLPIFGINYLNFEFRGRPDTQLALLFAGVLAAGNLQRPKLATTPFDGSVDFFAIAVPSSERVYDAGGEREDERLLMWPLTAGANLGWQLTPFQKLTGHYQFRFDGFVRDTTTVDSFRVPASTVSNGLGAGWEYRRGGYSAVLSGMWYARAGWRAWGFEDDRADATDPESTYLKYSASLSRDFYFNVFHKVHLNAAWFGGRDLDRFAKYQFGMFDDTRIHGVPSSGVRFEQLGMVRGSYSFNIFDQYRLDLFVEQAWGRDRAFDDRWQPITGLGTAINLRAPWSTILRTDFGWSRLPDRYSGIGSATLQVMLLKPLR